MNYSSIAAVQQINGINAVDITPEQTTLTPLDVRLSEAFSSVSSETAREYNAVMGRVNEVDSLSRPMELLELQISLADYKLKLEAISALTHKGVVTVETLLKT